jgi:hypothetical protein
LYFIISFITLKYLFPPLSQYAHGYQAPRKSRHQLARSPVMQPWRLYVTGNGFDLWHGIPSSISEFREYAPPV